MDLDDLNTDLASLGGQWRDLKEKADGALEGRILAAEKRQQTFDGEPVLSRKTKQPRYEWVITMQIDGEPDPIKTTLKESATRALAEALREAGTQLTIGDTLKLAVVADKEDAYSQPTYKAKVTKNAAPIVIDDTEEPF